MAALLQRLQLPLGGLLDRSLGSPVSEHRTSWVRRLQVHGEDYFVKVYDYPGAGDRWRGLLRFTGPWNDSRARREAQALHWLQQQGFPTPGVVAVAERRCLGVLRSAVLITEAWPGEPLDRLMPRLDHGQRDELAAALCGVVRELHARGFRDRNLDLRNLLARRVEGRGWQIAKIDSPRWRLVRPGRGEDRLARADWRRLAPQLAAFGLSAGSAAT